MKEISRLVQESPKSAADILLSLPNKDFGYLYFDDEDMKYILTELLESEKGKALEVLNALLKRGFYEYKVFQNHFDD